MSTRKCEHGAVIINGAECKDCTIKVLKNLNRTLHNTVTEYEQLISKQNEVIEMYIQRLKLSNIQRFSMFTSLKYQAIIKLISRAKQAIIKYYSS